MSRIWAGAIVISVVYGSLNGQFESTGAASLAGAGAAVDFVLSTGALICLWCGVLEIMRRSGIMDALSRALSRPLGKLFPRAARNKETFAALCANVSANFLGLGNAATPMGIKATPMGIKAAPGLPWRGERGALSACRDKHRVHTAAANDGGRRARG